VARVNVNVNVRDMTRGDLDRLQQRFNRLGRSMNRFAGDQSQRSLDGLRNSLRGMQGDLSALRGRIPEREFTQFTNQLREMDQQLAQGGFRQSARDIGLMRDRMENLNRSLGQMTRDATVRIRLDDRDVDRQSGSIGRRIGRGLFAPVNNTNRQILRTLSDTFSDGIGQALARGFQAAQSNPYVAAAVVALVASIAAMIGAAIGGLLVLAFGGAFVGLATMFAVQSKAIKEQWSATTESMANAMKPVGEALEPVVSEGIDLLNRFVQDFAPHFKEAMEEAVPHLSDFLGNIDEGLREFGRTAFEPMMDAFNQFLDVFGPVFEDFLGSLGDAFKDLAEAVIRNKDQLAILFAILLELLPLAIHLIARLVEMWGAVVDSVVWVTEKVSELWGWLQRNWNADVVFAAPGIGGIIESVSNLWGWTDRNWFRNVLFAAPGIGGITGFVSTLFGWVNRNWFRNVVFHIPGVGGVIALVRTLWGWVNRNWSRVVNFAFSMSGPVGAIRGLLGRASGGVMGQRVGTAATGGVRSNMTLVGEHGPEVVNLAPGSHVRSNPDSKRLMKDGGGVSGAVFEFKSSGRRADDLLLEIMRDAIHQRGGDPVLVLGG